MASKEWEQELVKRIMELEDDFILATMDGRSCENCRNAFPTVSHYERHRSECLISYVHNE